MSRATDRAGGAEAGTAVITGAARRLGTAMALELASRGWDLVLHYRTSGTAAEELAESIREQGRKAWTLGADLSDPLACRTLIESAREVAGSLHALINNASIFPKSTLRDFEPESLIQNVQIHGVAPALLAREFAELPEARHIINMVDSKVTGPDDEHFAYHLSKRMLHSLTTILARELAPQIAVNAIAPGAILAADGDSASKFTALANTVPMKRTGDPADIAQAAAFLLESRFMTGQTLFVDGGRHLEGRLYG